MNDIQLYSWDKAEELVYPVRLEVFVKEQGVPIDLELDEYDLKAQHVVFYHDGFPVGTGRVFKKNFEEDTFYIGRLCVLKKYRENTVLHSDIACEICLIPTRDHLLPENGKLPMSHCISF